MLKGKNGSTRAQPHRALTLDRASRPDSHDRPAIQRPKPDADARRRGSCRRLARPWHCRHDDDVQRCLRGVAAAAAVCRTRPPGHAVHHAHHAARRARALAMVSPSHRHADRFGQLISVHRVVWPHAHQHERGQWRARANRWRDRFARVLWNVESGSSSWQDVQPSRRPCPGRFTSRPVERSPLARSLRRGSFHHRSYGPRE